MVRISGDAFPPPPEHFIQRLQFHGTLAASGQTLPGIEAVIDYDETGKESSTGGILGNNETARAIEGLETRRLPRAARLSSADGGIEATVDFNNIITRGSGPGPTGLVAKFRCRELTLTSRVEQEPGDTRLMTFFMAGPKAHWGAATRRKLSYTGEASAEVQDVEVPLDIELPVTVEARPHFFYSQKAADRDEVVRNVLGITVKTTEPRAELADEAFAEAARGLVDDCSLLVSFLAGSWASWYGYVLWTSDRYVRHFRRIRSGTETDMQDTPVEVYKGRDFLRTALPRLRQLRSQRMEPRLAILHAISAAEARSLEERFIRLLLALESLKDLHSQERDSILPSGLFRRVKRALRGVLAEFASGDTPEVTQQQLTSLERKLPDLNRPAFAELVDAMLAEYGLEWRDLYPPDLEIRRPPFIALRDQLIHTGAVDSPPQLDLESIRVQGLVERVILKMLGWEDVSSSPRPWFDVLIRTQLGNEQASPT